MSSVETQKQILEVEIERLLPGGVGLAHAEGMTLFVSLAAPGDLVRVTLDRLQGKVGFASIVEVVRPSPSRVEPPCPYFGRCGGCDFQQLTYETQLNAKVEIVRDCLHRIAKIETPLDIVIDPSPNEWRYRARASWQYDRETKELGYFERGSNVVCDVECCAVLVPELEETLERVRNEIRSGVTPPQVKNFDVVAGDEGVSMFPSFAGVQPIEVSRVIGNERYFFSAEAFFQINHQLLPPLIAEALRRGHSGSEVDLKGEAAIDLYCGVGLFTVPLARRFKRVVGIESNERAAQFARRNLDFAKRGSSLTVREGVHNKLGSADFGSAHIVAARVGDWLRENSRAFGPVDFLLLDPPRAGSENTVIAGILTLRPARISYVSCDPATLARDLKKLIAGGYSIESVKAFDMFPQTHHLETVARLVME